MSRIISMVPSWTETLIECGIDVVGRTRFCIHPKGRVEHIPVVGGTKDIDWDKVYELNATHILLDQEENPKEMADASSVPMLATHVTSIEAVARECRILGAQLDAPLLNGLAERWERIHLTPNFRINFFRQLPGVAEWIKKPKYDGEIESLYYMIWKDPWMCVSRDTFIGSVITKLGLGFMMPQWETKYPTINLEQLNRNKTVIFFSSEPYPFHKKTNELKKLGYFSAVVNGENFSWFGLRSLIFLEEFFKNPPAAQ